MESGWLISYIVLWAITLLLVVVVLAHSRLLGLLHYRFGPAAARPLADGPDIGTKLKEISGIDVNSEKWAMSFPSDSELVLVFVSPQCSTCNEILPHIRDFSRTESSIKVVLISIIDDIGMNRAYVGYRKLEKMTYIYNEKLSDELNIEAIPYALYLNKKGEVVAKGLVNNYENLKGLKKIAKNKPIKTLGMN
jgi:methylamine dehydrogenase accessory protein MauD